MKTLQFLMLAATSTVLLATSATGGQAPVDLGMAGGFVILSKAGISTTGATAITGDLGVSPAAATYITGFGPILDAEGQFSTSPGLVTGKIYAATYAAPTPANLTTTISNMEAAYTDAAGRSMEPVIELGAGNISGMTLKPGLYRWATGLSIDTELTLEGCPEDVWIFQVAQNLTVANAAQIHLSGGAQAANIFWAVAGKVTLGTTSHFEGIILSKTAIEVSTGASINGRLLAQTEVTLDANAVTAPPPAPIMEERLLKVNSIARDPTGEVTLVFAATSGQLLTLQDSIDLISWTTISTTVVADDPYVITEPTSLADEKRFYRAFYHCD